jgi:hypothetical protein
LLNFQLAPGFSLFSQNFPQKYQFQFAPGLVLPPTKKKKKPKKIKKLKLKIL